MARRVYWTALALWAAFFAAGAAAGAGGARAPGLALRGARRAPERRLDDARSAPTAAPTAAPTGPAPASGDDGASGGGRWWIWVILTLAVLMMGVAIPIGFGWVDPLLCVGAKKRARKQTPRVRPRPWRSPPHDDDDDDRYNVRRRGSASRRALARSGRTDPRIELLTELGLLNGGDSTPSPSRVPSRRASVAVDGRLQPPPRRRGSVGDGPGGVSRTQLQRTTSNLRLVVDGERGYGRIITRTTSAFDLGPPRRPSYLGLRAVSPPLTEHVVAIAPPQPVQPPAAASPKVHPTTDYSSRAKKDGGDWRLEDVARPENGAARKGEESKRDAEYTSSRRPPG